MQEVSSRIFPRIERARAEAALRESEEKYRKLFESIDDGYCMFEVIPDEHGRVTDLMYHEANQAYERHSGMSDFLGKRVSEVLPNLEQYWLDLLTSVYQTGAPVRTENYIADLDRWIHVYYSRVGGAGSPLITAVFDDITERKRAEEKQAFLLKLSDALRAETGVEAVGNRAVHMIAEKLRVDRVYLVTVTPGDDIIVVTHEARREDMPPLRGSYRGSDFPAAMKEIFERTIVYTDIRSDPRLTDLDRLSFAGLGAVGFMAAPIRRGSEAMIWAAGAVSTQPRLWTATDVALFEDAVERTWAAVERARAEAALRESEERLQSIANLVPDLLWDSESDGSTNWYNQRWLEYTGQSFAEAISWGWVDAIHPDDREASARRYREAVENGAMLRQEHRIRRYDGVYRWFVVHAFPFKDASGQVIKMYGAATDIHESRLMNEALSASEQRLRALIENLPGTAAFIVDRDLRYTLAEGEALRAVGATPERYIGKIMHETLEPAEAADYEVRYRQAFGGEPFTHEHQINGHSFVSRGVPLRRANNEIYAVLVVSYDITDRRRAEGALRDSEARFRTLTDAVPQVIWTNDSEGHATYFNQRWYEYSGLNFEGSVDLGWQAIVHPDDAPASIERWNAALAASSVFDTEYRLRRADGVYRWHLGRNVPLRDESGHVIGWFGSATDIEALKQAEEALERARNELETRVEERTTELLEVSTQRRELLQRLLRAQEDERQRIARELHDTLGQFLSALNFRLSTVESMPGVVPTVQEGIQGLRTLATKIDAEVDRLTMELRPPALDDFGLIDALATYTQEWAASTGIPVDIVPMGIDGERLPPIVEATAYRVVQEALTNVLKHAQATQVSVIVNWQPTLLQVIIEDNGQGFDSEALAHQGAGGRQLGLLGMVERATLAQGTLRVESERGSGTTIYLDIPLSQNTAS